MKNISRVLIVLALLAVMVPVSVFASFQVQYSYTDPNGRFAYSTTPGQLIVSSMTRNEEAWGNLDYGASHFSGNFSFNVDVKTTSMGSAAYGIFWAMSTEDGSISQIYNGGTDKDFNDLYFLESGAVRYVFLRESNNQALTVDGMSFPPVVGTIYYFNIYRDLDVGAFGTLYAAVYGTIEDRQDDTNRLDTMSVALSETKDWRYFYRVSSFNTGGAETISFTQYKSYAQSPLPSYELVPPSAVGGYYSHPYAVGYSGTNKYVYFTWLDYVGRVWVNYYDAETGDVGVSPFEISQTGAAAPYNEHGTPSLTVITSGTHAGKILVTWADVNTGTISSRRSTNSEDVTAFDAAVVLSTGGGGAVGAFCQPVQLSDGDLMVVYRWVVSGSGVTAYHQIRYRIWDATSDTWDAAVVLVDYHSCCGDGIALYPTVYVQAGSSRIDVAWNTKVAVADEYKYLYHTQSLDNGATWEELDGTPIALPIDSSEHDIVSLREDQVFIWDISYFGGTINILYNANATGANPDKVLDCMVVRSSGGAWTEYKITSVRALYDLSPGVTSGMSFNRDDPHQIYVGAADGAKGIEIQEWYLTDGGVASKTSDITSSSLYGQIRPKSVVNLGLGSDILMWSTADHAEGAGTWMGFLSVDSLPLIETELMVDTLDATLVEETTAQLNGNITVFAGNATSRCFVWDTVTHVNPGNVTPADAGYADWCTTSGDWGNGTFGANITGLSPGECLYYRAWAYTPAYGWVYGDQETLVTKPGAPAGLAVTYVNENTLMVDWAVGSGADGTMVRRSTSGNPSSYTDGDEAYDGSGVSFSDGGLAAGEVYYYCAWSYASACGETVWSDAASCDSGNTTSSGSVLDVSTANVFRDYVEKRDMLFVLGYKNTYAPEYPNSQVDRLFHLRLLDTNGITVLHTTTCKQWGMRPGAIYLSADQAAALTVGEPYIVQLYGNFGSTPSDEYVLMPSDWRGKDLQFLDRWAVSFAETMETNDSAEYTVLVSSARLLNEDGGNLFSLGIPALREQRPNLFYSSTYTPDMPGGSDVDARAGSATIDDMVGADVEAAIDAVGAEFGISGENVSKLGFYLLAAVVVMIVATFWNIQVAIIVVMPWLAYGMHLRVVDAYVLLPIVFIAGSLWLFDRFLSRAG